MQHENQESFVRKNIIDRRLFSCYYISDNDMSILDMSRDNKVDGIRRSDIPVILWEKRTDHMVGGKE